MSCKDSKLRHRVWVEERGDWEWRSYSVENVKGAGKVDLKGDGIDQAICTRPSMRLRRLYAGWSQAKDLNQFAIAEVSVARGWGDLHVT